MTFIDNVDQAGKPQPAQRPKHTQEYLRTVYACGERRDHRVRIHRSHWPPRPNPSLNDRAFVEGACERCGGILQIYDPPDRSVTVVLFGSAEELEGRVEDENAPGEVVGEEQAANTGGRVEEEPDARGRRRR